MNEKPTPITDTLFVQVGANNYANPSGVSTNRLREEFRKLELGRETLRTALENLVRETTAPMSSKRDEAIAQARAALESAA